MKLYELELVKGDVRDAFYTRSKTAAWSRRGPPMHTR